MKIEHVANCWVVIGAICLLGTFGCQSTGNTSTARTVKPAPAAELPAAEPRSTQHAVGLEPVYFDLDAWELRADARETLRATADEIRKNPDWGTVTIEGHCDERGNEEYNLALGERRAAAVKRYLRDLGVSTARVEVVSFGESRPAVSGHDESAWRYNRRSELKPASQRITQR